MNPALYALMGIVVSVIGSVVVARFSDRAVARQAETQADLGSSALALRIANRADRKASHAERRLDSYDRWRRQVTEVWWPEHRMHYDQVIVDEIRRLDPDAEIPLPRPMPRYSAPAEEPDDEDDPDDENPGA